MDIADKIIAVSNLTRNTIIEKYGIDPNDMDTIEGWIDVGRKLKAASNGEVYLSYVDPGSRAWRYWGRRGLLPQAEARIWDEKGDIVIKLGNTDINDMMSYMKGLSKIKKGDKVIVKVKRNNKIFKFE